MIELSVVIPAYNEDTNLKKLMEKLNCLNEPNIEIILVDNGSTDNTAQLFEELSLNNTNVTFIRKAKNTGYGSGILYGLARARGSVLCWTHADLQTQPADILRAYKIYKNSEDTSVLIKGVRVNRFVGDVIMSKAMQTFASLLLGHKFNEINAQPKLFSRVIYNSFLKSNPPSDFSLDLAIMNFFLQNGYKILEFPVTFDERFAGEAKGGGSSLITITKISLRTIKFIIRLKKQYNQSAINTR